MPQPGNRQQTYPCATCQPQTTSDDHPKIHYGERRYHYDCMPPEVRADVLGDQTDERQQRLAQIVAEAESGTHGAQLRDRIVAINPNGV